MTNGQTTDGADERPPIDRLERNETRAGERGRDAGKKKEKQNKRVGNQGNFKGRAGGNVQSKTKKHMGKTQTQNHPTIRQSNNQRSNYVTQDTTSANKTTLWCP